ncbi:MAG: hypothetical protein K0R54_1049 [Clostridiaceae bacterium]|jgi:hypothetical protein|nr:hypothetical protein [Clostridiaceae bacterium]
MKRIKPLYLMIIIAFLLASVILQYRDNEKIKAQQGVHIQNNLDFLQFQLKNTSEYLSLTQIPEQEYLYLTSAKFSEDTAILNGIMYSSMPLTYLDMIRIDLNRMSGIIKDKKSENELIEAKQFALDKITILLNELSYIKENCKSNTINYYELSKPNNAVMKKVNKEMIDYLNKNYIH